MGSKKDATHFRVGQKVYARSKDGIYYNARVKSFDSKKDRYRIHFFGWNDRFDEFVSAAFVLEQTEENKRVFMSVEAADDQSAQASAAPSGPPSPDHDPTAPGSPQSDDEQKDEPETPTADRGWVLPRPSPVQTATKRRGKKGRRQTKKPAPVGPVLTKLFEGCGVELRLPEVLIDRLAKVDERVANGELLTLPVPADHSVDAILGQFEAQAPGVPETAMFVGSMRALFNSLCRPFLVYEDELDQFDGLGATVPAEVLGIDHLTRLFVRLPAILEYLAEPAVHGLLLAHARSLLDHMAGRTDLLAD
ncbi:hypothetical protein J8273_3959 [Carpediemonas membranifera]|uniref:MRG domain-containing protein n=1 Tax=Carpediemonas membranifera TaxID=201153 RepID=A0A8J6AWM7_9EUKA|nr:hypothetical protein J8273_3959 [Carpediemonas membranifera]|eukprot:KAG9394325.1 hypothetical protein J8273_3959 [Carpediemonas membranifera]